MKWVDANNRLGYFYSLYFPVLFSLLSSIDYIWFKPVGIVHFLYQAHVDIQPFDFISNFLSLKMIKAQKGQKLQKK